MQGLYTGLFLSVQEEKLPTTYFPADYPAYRARVLMPWL